MSTVGQNNNNNNNANGCLEMDTIETTKGPSARVAAKLPLNKHHTLLNVGQGRAHCGAVEINYKQKVSEIECQG